MCVSLSAPTSGRLTARISVSASQLVDYDRCERAWYLASVQRAPDDANAGGQYLLQGDLYDEAVQRFSAKMYVGADDLTGAVRAKPGLRGAALTTADDDWQRMAERAQRMLRATQHLLPPPKTAKIQHRYRVFVPGYEARGGVVVTGALDLRRPGEVWDTKSTTDRGPGRGRDAQTQPFALTDETTPGGNVRPLAENVQARLYAWCEFQEDPLRLSVRCTWVYASKPSSGAPRGWSVSHVFLRADTLAWFESYARPRIERMLDLHDASEFEFDQRVARANHDGCLRCFRRLSCQPFSGAQNTPDPKTGAIIPMALDLKKLRAGGALAAPAPVATPYSDAELAERLAASVDAAAQTAQTRLAQLTADAAAVANGLQDDRRADVPPRRIHTNVVDGSETGGGRPAVSVNRPDAPPNPHAPGAVVAEPKPLVVIETVGVEAAADPATDPEFQKELAAEPAPAAEPRRGRGRPRKNSPAAAPEVFNPVASGTDPVEELEAFATAAQGLVDQASRLVSDLNAALRARGVRV